MKGRVYYDEADGAILGVSIHPSPDFDGKPCLEVDYDIAVAFLEGTEDTSSWAVISSPDQTARKIACLRDFPLEKSESFAEFSSEGITPASIVLMVTLPNEGSSVEVRLINRINRAPQIKVARGEALDLMFTDGDLDNLLCRISVDLTKLVADRAMTLKLPRAIQGERVSVFSQGLRDIAREYRVSETENVNIEEDRHPLPLPSSRYEELVPVPYGTPGDPSLILLINDARTRLEVSLYRGGGPVYDRDVSQTLLIVAEPNNPDAVLFTRRLSLVAGAFVEFDIPLPEAHTLYVQKMFANVMALRHPLMDTEMKFPSKKSKSAKVEFSWSPPFMLVESHGGIGNGRLVCGEETIMVSYEEDRIYRLPSLPSKVISKIDASLSKTSPLIDQGMIATSLTQVQSIVGIKNAVVFDFLDRSTLAVSIMGSGGPTTDAKPVGNFVIKDALGEMSATGGLFNRARITLPRQVEGKIEITAQMPYLRGYFIAPK